MRWRHDIRFLAAPVQNAPVERRVVRNQEFRAADELS